MSMTPSPRSACTCTPGGTTSSPACGRAARSPDAGADHPRVRGERPVDLGGLSRRESLVFAQAPVTGEQSLPGKDLVDAGDASGEPVSLIERGTVEIGELGRAGQQLERYRSAAPHELTDLGVQPYGLRRADRPLSQQATDDVYDVVAEPERGQQIDDDVVVVAGVQRDVAGPSRLDDGADHVDRRVPVERRDLDRDDAVDLGERPPEVEAEAPVADRGLDVEAANGHDLGDPGDAGQDLRVAGVAPPGRGDQRQVVAKATRDGRLVDCLPRRTQD